jgi:hypothetical protein
MRVFCDMDQVLVNFLAGARIVFGREFNHPDNGDINSRWAVINALPRFWVDLPWMPEADRLWSRLIDTCPHCRTMGENLIPQPCTCGDPNYIPYVLSACPPPDRNPSCPSQKKDWCVNELEDFDNPAHCITVHSRAEKKQYAMTNGKPNLLIDDHPLTIKEWEREGGIGILHHTVPETLRLLDRYRF